MELQTRPADSQELAERLSAMDLFADVERQQIDAIASQATVCDVPAGATLMEQGEEALATYILIDGRLTVSVSDPAGNERALTGVEPGSIVGEIPLLAGGRRTATVRAAESSLLAVIDAQTFARLLDDEPALAGRLSAVASHRLRQVQLAAHLQKLFEGVDGHAIADLAHSAEWRSLGAGETLFRQGDPGDAAYLVVAGRVRVALTDPDTGSERVIGEIATGEMVGEQAILLDSPRSASVFAARDTELARFPRSAFSAFVESHPATMLAMIRTIVARSRSSMLRPRRRGEERVSVGLLPLDDDLREADFELPIRRELEKYGTTFALDAERIDSLLAKNGLCDSRVGEPAYARMLQWLSEVEDAHRFVVYRGDRRHPNWTGRTIRQADHLILLARADGDPAPREIERSLQANRQARAQRTSLVLIHPAHTERATNTAAWLDRRDVDVVYHVRAGDPATFARLGRILAGRAVGLVLGGGGARGFAHLGVLRVLEELGVPVDMIGGASIGATIAVPVAQGLDTDGATAMVERCFRSLMDYTLPLASLLAGRRISQSIVSSTGSWDIEDLWIPYFCVSTNLTNARTVVHRRGNMARAVRASVAIPGVLPPVPVGEELLVDGGVLNNLPVDVMREINPTGPVIAVDVVPRRGPRAKSDYGLSLSGWSVVAHRLLPGGKPIAVPSLATTILRSTIVGAERARDRVIADELADLYLSINAAGIGLLAFDNVTKVARLGYEAALEPIRSWLASIAEATA